MPKTNFKGGRRLHALGTHLLVELRDCNPKILKDLKKVKNALVSAAKEAKATIVDISFHEFSPFGISGMVIIAESHLSIHTWPEYSYAAVDIFTCGDLPQNDHGDVPNMQSHINIRDTSKLSDR